MTTDVQDRPREPKRPNIGMFVAVLIELGVLTTLISNKSIVGVLLCAAYLWFSATWAFFRDLHRDD